jgi:hypothetical protein
MRAAAHGECRNHAKAQAKRLRAFGSVSASAEPESSPFMRSFELAAPCPVAHRFRGRASDASLAGRAYAPRWAWWLLVAGDRRCGSDLRYLLTQCGFEVA